MTRPILRRSSLAPVIGGQRRTFLGLRRPPAPKAPMMGYLVVQGLAIVLLADFAIATVQNEPTTVRSVCQTLGFWQDPPEFGRLHGKDGAVVGRSEE